MCNICDSNNSAKGASAFTTNYFNNVVEVDLKNAKSSLDNQKKYAKKGLLVESVLCLKDASGKTIFDAASYQKFSGEGKQRPDTIHPLLWEHANLNMNVGLYRVNNFDNMFTVAAGDVFQVRGYDIANMTLLRGVTGWIIMDVLTTSETAAAAMEFVEAQLGKLDVVAVIYSHSHVDHYGGVGGVLQGASNVEIIAPENFLDSAVSENVYAGNAMNSRAVFMYGSMLEHSAKGQIDAGLGKATAVGTRTLMPPTVEIKYNDADRARGYCEMIIDGLSMQFQLTPGTEAPAEMNVYVPSENVLFIAENCCGTLHNLYTLRGAEVRDPIAWADYLDETIKVFHDVQTICSSHNWPQFSERDNSACIDYLKKQRDVYRYLGNTALNLINKGYTIDAATQYVAAMGGGGVVLAKANAAYKSGNYAWAAELLNRLIFARVRECDANIKNQAKLLNADVLEQQQAKLSKKLNLV